MPPVIYTRSFTHADWLDNVDRVQAGGSNGFNGRFHLLEAEFDILSGVVKQVNDALTLLGQQPTPQPTPTTFTPALTATSANGWAHREGLAEKPGGVATAEGMMNIVLPNGSRIISLRAIGRSAQAPGSGAVANLRIRLRRQAVIGAPTSDSIATIAVDGPADPFDITVAATPTFEHVDPAFKYFITALVSSAGLTDPVQLTAFQVTTIAAS
jgi:hypothetical protein